LGFFIGGYVEAKINAVDMMDQVTLNVKVVGTRELSIRTWIAIILIKLAAKIMNMQIAVDLEQ